MAIVVGITSQTKTLLDGVNEILKRTQAISADTALTVLTGNAKQNAVDIAIQALNELIVQVHDDAQLPMPKETAEGTIILATSSREYTLASDLITLRYPLINQTNGDTIDEYLGGYKQLFRDQTIPTNYTGQPQAAAISPITAKLYLDRIPTATEDGDIYTYLYDKDLMLSVATDTFPFDDVVFWALVPAAAQIVKREMQGKFDSGIFKSNFGRAARLLTKQPRRHSWLPQQTTTSNTDPYAG